MRKITLAAITLLILLGVIPAAAEPTGTWVGEGKGYCYPYPDKVIYPWQYWKGEIPDDKEVFYGEWWDEEGNVGTFEGKLYPNPIEEKYIYKGIWVWTNPDSDIYKSGDFTMTFYLMLETCEGNYTTIYPSPVEEGTMWGKWVE